MEMLTLNNLKMKTGFNNDFSFQLGLFWDLLLHINLRLDFGIWRARELDATEPEDMGTNLDRRLPQDPET